MQEKIFDIDTFKEGLHIYEDSTKSPIGSARKMVNCRITDRGGISKRQGVQLLGSWNSDTSAIKSYYIYKKQDNDTILHIKSYSTYLDYYHPTLKTWNLLQGGYTSAQRFGLKESLTPSDSTDYLYGCNRIEDYFKWSGTITETTGTNTVGALFLNVTSIFRSDIYYSATASASTATTLDISSALWTASQWIGFYVHIVGTGKVRKITANTSTQITFDTLGADPGDVAFQILYTDFAASGSLIVGGNVEVYSAIDLITQFTTTALTTTCAAGAAVTQKITVYPGAPKGNMLDLLYARMYNGNVRNGLLRNSAGTLGGSANEASVYVSEVTDPTDYTFAATRAAGEGAIIPIGQGGAGLTDLVAFEDAVYAFKKNYIESIKFTQDTSDIAAQTPISTSYGSAGRVIKAFDDLYFITTDNQFTSLGRVAQKDLRVQSINIGLPVKRLIETYAVDPDAVGGSFQNRIYIPFKASSISQGVDRLLVYNREGRFEGEWYIPATNIRESEGVLYAGLSSSANVVQLLTGLNDVLDTTYGISSEWLSNWMNLNKSKFDRQSFSCFACEGYILGNTKLSFGFYKDLLDTPFLSFDFQGTESQVDEDFASRFLGSLPLGIEPIGAISSTPSEEYDGMRHFMFLIYFPWQYATQLSWGWTNSGISQNYEIIRTGFDLTQDSVFDFINRIKTL